MTDEPQTAPSTDRPRRGFSLAYEVDLTDTTHRKVSVTLSICTREMSTLYLSPYHYHGFAVQDFVEPVEFDAVPAESFSVVARQRAAPEGREPEWRLSFRPGTTITAHYERTFSLEPDATLGILPGYFGQELFLATGERSLVLPETREGDLSSGPHADTLQEILVRYRLPEGWTIRTPVDGRGSGDLRSLLLPKGERRPPLT